MVVHVFREMRQRQAKLEKKGGRGPAIISTRELRDLFPGVPDTAIKKLLRERCDCVAVKVGGCRTPAT
jgi:hypothetical protein